MPSSAYSKRRRWGLGRRRCYSWTKATNLACFSWQPWICLRWFCSSLGYALNKMSLRYKTQSQSYIFVNKNFCLTAAGVLGTTQILFQSERRGLQISDRLGKGFSTNGNNFAYLAGSSLPLNGQGLSKEQFSNIPFQNRPGPSVSSSFISSLGFTIEVKIL